MNIAGRVSNHTSQVSLVSLGRAVRLTGHRSACSAARGGRGGSRLAWRSASGPCTLDHGLDPAVPCGHPSTRLSRSRTNQTTMVKRSEECDCEWSTILYELRSKMNNETWVVIFCYVACYCMSVKAGLEDAPRVSKLS